MKPAIVSAISGLAWGLLGAYLTRKVAGPHSWFAAPGGIVIGLVVFWISRWTYRKPFWVLVPTAILSTFIAVAVFGFCLGVADLIRDMPNRIGWAVVVQSMNACLWGLFFVPLYWSLFLLAFGNHALVRHFWRIDGDISDPPNDGSVTRPGNLEAAEGRPKVN